MRGGEKCVEALCEVFPHAHLFALVHVPGTVSPTIERMPITTSFIQRLPFSAQRYRHYLPLFPTAVQLFDLRDYDIVITSHHAVAKGVKTAPQTLHICYCHTPMRYIWNLYDEYFAKDRAGLLTRSAMSVFVKYLRRWDIRTARNPHYFVANSQNVRNRIRTIYHRESDVIYPPVDCSLFTPSTRNEGYFLIVSAFVPYKRLDIAIQAFNKTGQHLRIIGDGPEASRLRKLAGRTIEFLGWQPDAILKEAYAGCRALVFPGEEDFGIVPVEAMASGKPVIAFGKGGALETVLEADHCRTGVLFMEQSVESLLEALQRFERMDFDSAQLRKHALGFDKQRYKAAMAEYITNRWHTFLTSPQLTGK